MTMTIILIKKTICFSCKTKSGIIQSTYFQYTTFIQAHTILNSLDFDAFLFAVEDSW